MQIIINKQQFCVRFMPRSTVKTNQASVRRPRKRINRAIRQPKRNCHINRVERRRAKLSPEHHVEREPINKIYHSDNHKYNYDE
jgi:hypothetical protein